MSYGALARRAQGPPRRPLAERFSEDHLLLLDSGAFQANSHPEKRTLDGWGEYAKQYAEFALDNAERCTLITEFDFLGLGPDWIDEMRRGVWREIGDKFLPVWHSEQGLASLEATADRYGRIAVIGDMLSTPGQSASAQLMRLARRGVEVHGLALTKPEIVDNMPFTSVASTSWAQPMVHGDVQVWDGRSMHRYPVRYAEQGVRRHQHWIGQQGFDVEAWADLSDDGRSTRHVRELVKVAIWSWLRWSEYATERHGPVAVPTFSDAPPDTSPDNSLAIPENGNTAHAEVLPLVRTRPVSARTRDLVDLPVFGFTNSGEGEARELIPLVSEISQRVCDRCFLSSTCPAYESGSVCAYKMPVRVETKGQKKALFNGIIEMQTQRVAFLRMSEEQSGGLPDPNTSTEMDRLAKLMATQAEIEDDRDYFSMQVTARGKSGVISRLLGADVGAAASQSKRPFDEIETDRIIAGSIEP